MEAIRLRCDRLHLAGEHRARLYANVSKLLDEMDGLGELERAKRVPPHVATRRRELFVVALLKD
ncbi:MAG: hypothetical protein VXY92_05205 [Planctomycetota bacterium]|nr:hypothetical protein [Planctomycetota bacterium]